MKRKALMVDTFADSTNPADFIVSAVLHPLEPLNADEITGAVSIVRSERQLGPTVRFVAVTLHEPAPEVALHYQAGDPITREAFMVLLDKSGATSATYEAIVNIWERKVTSWKHIPSVQASIMLEEFFAAEQAIKAHPDFQAALARRGITNLDLVYVDAWSAGNYGAPEEHERRILRTTAHMRLNPDDPEENSYAHPIAGLHAIFDLTMMQLLRIEDYGIIPVPQQHGNYTKDAVCPLRSDLKPQEITHPVGPSISVNVHGVSSQYVSV